MLLQASRNYALSGARDDSPESQPLDFTMPRFDAALRRLFRDGAGVGGNQLDRTDRDRDRRDYQRDHHSQQQQSPTLQDMRKGEMFIFGLRVTTCKGNNNECGFILARPQHTLQVIFSLYALS